MASDPTARSDGFAGSPHDQVLRNQRVGKTRSRATSGPRLCTVMRMRMSSASWRIPRTRQNTGRRRRCRYQAVRTRTLPVSVSDSFRPGPGTDTPDAGTCRDTSRRSAGALSREVVLLDIFAVVPSLLVSPNRRSFKIGSRSFHNASAKQSCCLSSQRPPSPSSPQR